MPNDYSDPLGPIYVPPVPSTPAPSIPQIDAPPAPYVAANGDPFFTADNGQAMMRPPALTEPAPVVPEPAPAPTASTVPEPSADPFMIQSAGGSIVPPSSFNYTSAQLGDMEAYLSTPEIPGATTLVYSEPALKKIDLRTAVTTPIDPVGFIDTAGEFKPWTPPAPTVVAAPAVAAPEQVSTVAPVAEVKQTPEGVAAAQFKLESGVGKISGTYTLKGDATTVVEIPEATVKQLQTQFGQEGQNLSLSDQGAPRVNADGTISVDFTLSATPKPPAAVPDSVSAQASKLVSSGAKATLQDQFYMKGGAALDPTDPGYYDGVVDTYNTVKADFDQTAQYAQSMLDSGNLTAEDRVYWAKVRDNANAASMEANTAINKYGKSDVRANLALVQGPDAALEAELGITSKDKVAAGTEVNALLASLKAVDASKPAAVEAALNNAKAQVGILHEKLKMPDPSQPGSWMWTKNGYGETVGIKPEILFAGAGFGLALYESLYARPQEAEKQREYQLMLMDKQLEQQKELNQQMIDANMEIAQLEASTALEVADKNTSKGTPSSVNPGVSL